MFGLMRPEKNCGVKTESNYRFHRMHYCGTCKVLGQQYGHRSRLMLNFDTVFLAELLSLLLNENLQTWSAGFQAVNQCFKMPEKSDGLPFSLQYAAAASALLGELKLDDQEHDAPGIGWQLLRRFYAPTFRSVRRQMEAWGIELAPFRFWINKQYRLEKTARRNFPSLKKLLEHYAGPTAQMTGLIFKKGAEAAGRPEQIPAMYRLGYCFGQLAYVLDAFEDVEKDLARRHFNPLALFYSAQRTLAASEFEQVRSVILSCLESVKVDLSKLQLAPETIERYVHRLEVNVSLRIYKERTVPRSHQQGPRRIGQTLSAGGRYVKNYLQPYLYRPQYYLVSAAGLILPLAADYINRGHRTEVYHWMAVFAGLLAVAGLGRIGKKTWKNGKVKRKWQKIKRRWRRILRLKNQKNFFLKRPCLEDCAAACCESCFQGCCDWVCDEGCYWFNDTVCAACGDAIREGKIWPWLVLSLLVIGLGTFIVFVLVF
ncbi:MAG: DUF5685 family protein [Bacteroidota bacterium]